MFASQTQLPTIRLPSGCEIPQIGFGTWRVDKDIATRVINDAIDVGYRHFDLAYVYGNQKEIGVAIKESIASKKITRGDLFLTNKIWNSAHSFDRATAQLDEILADMQLDYLDMMLIHSPMGWKEGFESTPKDATGQFEASDIDYLETWSALEAAVDKGKVKHIGISNFNSKQIQRIIDNCRIKPANLQVETHLYCQQRKLRKFCKDRSITFTGWASMGNPGIMGKSADKQKIMINDIVIQECAAKYKKTAPQIALRWAIQNEIIIIPKSTSKGRMAENFEVAKFEIGKEDMKKLNDLDTGKRLIGLMPGIDNHKDYPFNEEF